MQPCREMLVIPPDEGRYESQCELHRIDHSLAERFPAYRFIVTVQSSLRAPDTFVLVPILGAVAATGVAVREPPPMQEVREIGAFLHEAMGWDALQLH